MTLTLPLWTLPFLIVAFGFGVIRFMVHEEAMGMAVLVLVISVVAAVSFTAGMLVR